VGDKVTVPWIHEPVTVAADTFGLDLTVDGAYPHPITGKGKLKKEIFGIGFDLDIWVMESIVDSERQLLCLLVHLTGELKSLLIVDGKERRIRAMLINSSKLNWSAGKDRMLPRHWNRELVYKKIANGVKATFEKPFDQEGWDLVHKGNAWVHNYLEKKRSIQSQSTGVATYHGTNRIA